MGWIARGRRVLEGVPEDCSEWGWLLVLNALPVMFEGDPESVYPEFVRAEEIGALLGDLDLAMFSRLARGWSLIVRQLLGEGMALLDEVMIAVVGGELSPIITGIVYCSVIALCQSVFDLRRAWEWTNALTRWCEAQPDMVPFRGNCLVHRCEIFQFHGAWQDALNSARQACDLLAPPPFWDSFGLAHYQLGEIQRLRGEFAQAEAAYRQASRAGQHPEPGMSLLRLAQGRSDAAAAGIQRALDETQDAMGRAKVLPACVEIMLETRDLESARRAADELQHIAADFGVQLLRAQATLAKGAVLLTEGDARAALVELRNAHSAWRVLDSPYQVARVRVLTGLACRELDDDGGAGLEFEAARGLFADLGAIPDLERVHRLLGAPITRTAGGLSPREREVLMHLATGKTNRAIAAELFLSEKTVARHVSNIFTKLDLASRAEATAYAYKHGLIH
jgi:DNA-binding CsgD family transcriptional regulator